MKGGQSAPFAGQYLNWNKKLNMEKKDCNDLPVIAVFFYPKLRKENHHECHKVNCWKSPILIPEQKYG